MPIDFHDEQAVVSCKGDVVVLQFGPSDGVAWLLLQEREAGEVGRDGPDLEPMCLREQPGVLVAADDPRSLDVIIDALVDLRVRLARGEGEAVEEGAHGCA